MTKDIPQTASFSVLDRMYLGTGCNSSMYAKSEKEIKDRAREEMRESCRDDKIKIYSIGELMKPFPNIGGLFLREVCSKSGDVTRYFENLGDYTKSGFERDNLSHNSHIYQQQDDKFVKLVDNEICAVKIADTKENKLWGLGGVYEGVKFDNNYFGEQVQGRYVLTHGLTSQGHVLIKEICEEKFNQYKDWFENIHKLSTNKYAKNKLKLENILRERSS